MLKIFSLLNGQKEQLYNRAGKIRKFALSMGENLRYLEDGKSGDQVHHEAVTQLGTGEASCRDEPSVEQSAGALNPMPVNSRSAWRAMDKLVK